MRFEEAMYYARQGKKIRRKAWGRLCYIKMGLVTDSYNRDKIVFLTRFGNEVNLNKAIFEKDWVVMR